MIGQILLKLGEQEEGEAELNRSQDLRAIAFQVDKAAHDVHETGQHEVLPELKNSYEKTDVSRGPSAAQCRRKETRRRSKSRAL